MYESKASHHNKINQRQKRKAPDTPTSASPSIVTSHIMLTSGTGGMLLVLLHHKKHALLLLLLLAIAPIKECCATMANDPKQDSVLSLYATAYKESPNDLDFYGIGGIVYEEATDTWTGMNEGNPGVGFQTSVELPRIYKYKVQWERYFNETSPRGTIDIISKANINPGDGLKAEGIVKVPCNTYTSSSLDFAPDYFIVSESNSNTQRSSSYFTKNFGHPDVNTFVPDSFRNSRFLRVGSNGEEKEEITLPDFMLWDGQYNWDPRKCYGNRVLKGLHSLTLLEATPGSEEKSQVIMTPQLALYQDGPEPTIFDGSQARIMFWDVIEDENDEMCSTGVQYSRSYKYETSRMVIETFQKGARHVGGIFGVLAISRTELLIAENEFLEALGFVQFISDVFYVKFDEDHNIDDCKSLLDPECASLPFPEKRHLIRRNHPYEMSDLAWGPSVEVDGEMMPTIAMSFEDDNVVGVLMELYTFNKTNLEFAPLWENSKSSTNFVATRLTVLGLGCGVFILGVLVQLFCVRRKEASNNKKNAAASSAITVENNDNDQEADEPEAKLFGFPYRNYILVSAISNSTLLGKTLFEKIIK